MQRYPVDQAATARKQASIALEATKELKDLVVSLMKRVDALESGEKPPKDKDDPALQKPQTPFVCIKTDTGADLVDRRASSTVLSGSRGDMAAEAEKRNGTFLESAYKGLAEQFKNGDWKYRVKRKPGRSATPWVIMDGKTEVSGNLAMIEAVQKVQEMNREAL